MRQAARWRIASPPAPAVTDALTRALKIPAPLAGLLVQRGFASVEAAKVFLRPDLDQLSDPLDLPGMSAAVTVVVEAVRGGQGIMVHGDYDVDGQCATAILTRALRAAGARVVPFIPHRVADGYDLTDAGVDAALAAGVGLVITCDCGTHASAPIARLRAAGVRVVVTDHHLPGDLPPADAIVNPRLGPDDHPAAELCGAGVAFKLVQALIPALDLPRNLHLHLLDLVALATVADVVPLTGENRVLVRFGLKTLTVTRWAGVRALIESSGLGRGAIRAGQVGFVLAPRLNAAGRIGHAMDGLALLLCDDPEEAASGAAALETLNARRQAMDQEMLDAAALAVEAEHDLDRTHGLVLAREGWHAGVIGIVASRLVERFARPTILIALEGEEGKGSGRSIPGFDLHQAIARCSEHLVRFGGHRMAAGLTIARDRVDAFKAAFEASVRQDLSMDDLVPVQRVDAVVRLEALDEALEQLLRHLEPTGAGNPGPVFAVRGVRARNPQPVGTNHLRFQLDDGSRRLGAIAFGWGERVPAEWYDQPLDVAFRFERNEWRDTWSLQARVVDLKPAD
ncbi:MAG: single-stranded-DNA-specific exonuclease RecJ [Gemmatimonadales bacterium]